MRNTRSTAPAARDHQRIHRQSTRPWKEQLLNSQEPHAIPPHPEHDAWAPRGRHPAPPRGTRITPDDSWMLESTARGLVSSLAPSARRKRFPNNGASRSGERRCSGRLCRRLQAALLQEPATTHDRHGPSPRGSKTTTRLQAAGSLSTAVAYLPHYAFFFVQRQRSSVLRKQDFVRRERAGSYSTRSGENW